MKREFCRGWHDQDHWKKPWWPDQKLKPALDVKQAKVDGSVSLAGSIVGGLLSARSLEVAGSLDLGGHAPRRGEVRPAKLWTVDLSGACIKAELRLGIRPHAPPLGEEPGTVWLDKAILNLRCAKVGALHDVVVPGAAGRQERDSWPRWMMLGGFCYDRLGGLSSSDSFHQRRVAWFKEWLRRASEFRTRPEYNDGSGRGRASLPRRLLCAARLGASHNINQGYRPETYFRLAQALRSIGRYRSADDVLYEAQEIARRNSRFPKRMLLSMSRLLVGHGVGWRFLLFPFAWAVFLGVVGLGVITADIHFRDAPQGLPTWNDFSLYLGSLASLPPSTMAWRFFASLDQLLPVVALDKEFTDLIPKALNTSWAKVFFSAIGVFGWVLTTFVLYAITNAMRRD